MTGAGPVAALAAMVPETTASRIGGREVVHAAGGRKGTKMVLALIALISVIVSQGCFTRRRCMMLSG